MAHAAAKHLRCLGGAGSIRWGDTEHRPHVRSLPLQSKPEAIAALDWALLERLSMTTSAKQKLESVQLWRAPSTYYDAIKENLHLITRTVIGRIPVADATLYTKIGKLRPPRPDETILAYCNFFERPEWHKEPPRRRGLLEPLINDIIAQLHLDTAVKYTSREATRHQVLVTEYGIRADMVSWFDQLSLDELATLFGVLDADGVAHLLRILAMGYRPSCRIAHTVLEILAPSSIPTRQPEALETLFVDNAAFLGTRQQCLDAMSAFLARCSACGALAQVESPNAEPEQQYCLLGEQYCHVNKTRALPPKQVEKIAEINNLLFEQHRAPRSLTIRQLMSIVGTVVYAADILDIDLTSATTLLREHAAAATDAATHGEWHHRLRLTKPATDELAALLTIMLKNEPVHVVRGRRPPEATQQIEVYVDASRWGWGAVIIHGAKVQHIRTQWTPDEHTTLQLWSSVTSEPLALRRAICMTATPGTHLHVHTDHAPLTWALTKRWSPTPQYNDAIALVRELEQRGITVTCTFIPGHANPADALSRGAPPLLPVTRIGSDLIAAPTMG